MASAANGPGHLRPEPHEPVAVALSGGVDSAVAAMLLKGLGRRVVALHMSLSPHDPGRPGESVRTLAKRLGVPLHSVDLRPAFLEQVIQPFLEVYRRGMTPNPCVLCNPRIKFSLLHRHAVDLGIRWLATGHYARIAPPESDGRLRLLRGRDRAKDQSYFLFGLTQEHLSHALFPLGALLKGEVRKIAASAGLPVSSRPESQEICFIPDNDYRRFVEERTGTHLLPARGPVVDVDGRQVGEHDGIHRFTIGQRRGLRIPSSAPYYVVGLEPETNTVRVGRRKDLQRREFLVTDVNWIGIPAPGGPLEALVQVRSRHQEAPAVLAPDTERVLVRFHEPQSAVTPGQAAVFYRGDEVLGGGMIQQVLS
ncbi:MAG TPA: tRNA 2-thiouridine(34) synthase MnmA [Syntrophobacteria bacterium]|nr:tRNA 2-thiouridine(34) synthase MnmA [Syntrophobacteria bacterium]